MSNRDGEEKQTIATGGREKKDEEDTQGETGGRGEGRGGNNMQKRKYVESPSGSRLKKKEKGMEWKRGARRERRG